MSRRTFELSEKQLQDILEASRAVPLMYLSGGTPMGGSQQENANSAWQRIAKEMGFVWDSVLPMPERGQGFFTAEATEVKDG